MRSRSAILLILGLLALGLRIEHNVPFYDLGRDKRYQMIAAGNFAEGRGITNCLTTPADLARVDCSEQTWWAAGYPLTVGTLYSITNDLFRADFILIIVGLIAFLVATLRIFSLWLKKGDIEGRALIWILVFLGFSFTPFNYFQTNDLISTAFLLLVFSEAAWAVDSLDHRRTLVSGAAFFVSIFFKFSFYPFIVVVPICLTLLSLVRRDLRYSIHALCFLVPVLIGFGGLFIFLPQHAMPPSGVWTSGWFFENLTRFDPFAVKSLFFIDFIVSRAHGNWLILTPLHLLSFAAVAAPFLFTAIWVRDRLRKESSQGQMCLALFGLVTAFVTVGYLSWLSLRLPLFVHPIYPIWTFVQETRYFAPVMMFIIIFVFIAAFRRHGPYKWLRASALLLVFCMTGYSVMYWTWKHYDHYWNGRIAGSYWDVHHDDAIVADFLKRDTTLDRSKTVLGFVSHAGAYGYPTLLRPTDPETYPFPWFDWWVGSSEVYTSEPRTLLTKIHKQPTDQDRALLESHESVRLLELKDYDLYAIDILPEKKE